jgi:type IV pilus assembly protein PilP
LVEVFFSLSLHSASRGSAGTDGFAVREPEPFFGAKYRDRSQSYLEPFIYDMKDRKDPFKPFVESIGGPTGEGAFEGPLLPLQRFDMDDLRLIGIIWDVKEPKAMFMDPESKVHILSRDDRIGKNNGYVAAIREGEVVVVETIRAKGESITTSRVLKISR